jgi:hypothetical protein
MNHADSGDTTPTREPQVLTGDELIVYEAIATVGGPVDLDGLTGTTGLDEPAVRSALDRLTELKMIESGDDGARMGPNDWSVRGAR